MHPKHQQQQNTNKSIFNHKSHIHHVQNVRSRIRQQQEDTRRIEIYYRQITTTETKRHLQNPARNNVNIHTHSHKYNERKQHIWFCSNPLVESIYVLIAYCDVQLWNVLYIDVTTNNRLKLISIIPVLDVEWPKQQTYELRHSHILWVAVITFLGVVEQWQLLNRGNKDRGLKYKKHSGNVDYFLAIQFELIMYLFYQVFIVSHI